jgi:hypothetical protein
MRFNKATIKDRTREKGTLATYWISENGNYKVHKRLNGTHWLAFFRSADKEFSLVGPPVSSRQKAENLCTEHSLGLPW